MQPLVAKNLTLGYGESIVIDNLHVTIPEGQITILIGGNGSGKSTLLRSLARLQKPKEGDILLDGEDMDQLSTKEVAKRLSMLPQGPEAPAGLRVIDLVQQGRYPYRGMFNSWSTDDEEAVNAALESTRMSALKDRTIDSLSGGQKQRAWIALTLAQKTDTILLDEPTTYLDMTYQIEVLDLLFDLNEREGRTIVMVLHDINLACRYAHHIIAIKDKEIFAQGKPEEIITCDLINGVFDMPCDVVFDPVFGTPMCIPHGKGRYLL